MPSAEGPRAVAQLHPSLHRGYVQKCANPESKPSLMLQVLTNSKHTKIENVFFLGFSGGPPRALCPFFSGWLDSDTSGSDTSEATSTSLRNKRDIPVFVVSSRNSSRLSHGVESRFSGVEAPGDVSTLESRLLVCWVAMGCYTGLGSFGV